MSNGDWRLEVRKEKKRKEKGAYAVLDEYY